jgi:hypothetical protein
MVGWACCNQIQCVGNYRTCAAMGAGLCEGDLDGAVCSGIYTSILSCSDINSPSCFLYARSTALGDTDTRYSWGCGASGSTVLALATTTGTNGGVAASTSTDCEFFIPQFPPGKKNHLPVNRISYIHLERHSKGLDSDVSQQLTSLSHTSRFPHWRRRHEHRHPLRRRPLLNAHLRLLILRRQQQWRRLGPQHRLLNRHYHRRRWNTWHARGRLFCVESGAEEARSRDARHGPGRRRPILGSSATIRSADGIRGASVAASVWAGASVRWSNVSQRLAMSDEWDAYCKTANDFDCLLKRPERCIVNAALRPTTIFVQKFKSDAFHRARVELGGQ